MSDNEMAALVMDVRMTLAGLMARPARFTDPADEAAAQAASLPAQAMPAPAPVVPVARMAGRTRQAARRAPIARATMAQPMADDSPF